MLSKCNASEPLQTRRHGMPAAQSSMIQSQTQSVSQTASQPIRPGAVPVQCRCSLFVFNLVAHHGTSPTSFFLIRLLTLAPSAGTLPFDSEVSGHEC